MKLFILVLFFLFSLLSSATDFNANHRKGFQIKPTNVHQAYKSGDAAILTGEICVLKFKESGSSSCHEVEDDDFTIRAYFPDEAHEVTSNVQFTRDENKIYYSYQTPTLSLTSANSLTLVIAPKESHLVRLYTFRSKIEQRIILLDRLILKYQKQKKSNILTQYIYLRSTLQSIITKINNIVDQDPELLARISVPLQVDNQISFPLKYSALIGGYQMSLEATAGTVIEGDATKIKAKILNLTKGEYWFPKIASGNLKEDDEIEYKDDKYDYEATFKFKGVNVYSTLKDTFIFGDTIVYEFTSGPLWANQLNEFIINLDKITHIESPANSGKKKKGESENNQSKVKRYTLGNIKAQITVSNDNIAPTWNDLSEIKLSEKYFQLFPEINIELSDGFGRINESSIKFNLSGVDLDRKQININQPDLKLGSIDSNRTFTITGNEFDLPEGFYNISFVGSDLKGNKSIPYPYSEEVVIDKTPPVIQSVSIPNETILITRKPDFTIDILDVLSGIDVDNIQIYVNNIDITESFIINNMQIKSNFEVNQDIGINNYLFIIPDNAGNVTNFEYKLILGIEPPSIAITPFDGTVLDTLQTNVVINFTGTLIDSSRFSVEINDIDVTSLFFIINNQANSLSALTLKEGENRIKSKIYNQFGQYAEAANLITVILPKIVLPDPPQPPVEPKPVIVSAPTNTTTVIGVTQPEDPAYGASITITPESIEEDTIISIKGGNVNDLPIGPNGETFVTAGPVIEATSSKIYDETKTFKNPIIMSIPFDAGKLIGSSLKEENLIVTRFNEPKKVIETIKPFLVDKQNGLLFIKTDSFSFFTSGWGGNTDLPLYIDWYTINVHTTDPVNSECINTQDGKFCEIGSKSYKIIFEVDSLLTRTATNTDNVNVTCPTCSIQPNIKKTLKTRKIEGTNVQYVEVEITSELINKIETHRFEFSAKIMWDIYTYNVYARANYTLNQSPKVNQIPYLLPTDEECDVPGTICSYIGTNEIGISPNGEVARTSSINIGVPNYEALAIDADELGQVYWVEPTDRFKFGESNLMEFLVRKVNTAGQIVTMTGFVLRLEDWRIIDRLTLTDLVIKVSPNPISKAVYIALQNGVSLMFPKTTQEILNTDNSPEIYKIPLNGGSATRISQPTSDQTKNFKFIYSMAPDNFGNLYVRASRINSYNEIEDGIYRYSSSDGWEYFTCPHGGCSLNKGTFSTDGEHFNATGIKDIKVINNIMYLTMPERRCIVRMFLEDRHDPDDQDITNFAGQCGSTFTYNQENVPAKNAYLGRVGNVNFDKYGNIYFSEKIPELRFRVIEATTGLVRTIVGKGGLPLTYFNMPVDSMNTSLPVTSSYDYRYDAFTVDPDGNLYAIGGNFIYKVSMPLLRRDQSALPESVAKKYAESQVAMKSFNISLASFTQYITSTQLEDGSWDHERQYFGENKSQNSIINRFIDTVNNLDYLQSIGIKSGADIEKALTWIANQNFDNVYLISKQIDILTKFNAFSNKTGAVQQAISRLLKKLGTEYRPDFFGWGGSKYSITNNLDTSYALGALAKLYSAPTLTRIADLEMVSNYIIVVNKILSKQYGPYYGPFIGGWGFLEIDTPPNMETTLAVVDALLSFRELPSNNALIVDPIKKDDLDLLKNTTIPVAIKNALLFIYNGQAANGSFGSIRQTADVIGLFEKIKKSGVITEISLLSDLDSKINAAVQFLQSNILNHAEVSELAKLRDTLKNYNAEVKVTSEVYDRIIKEPQGFTIGQEYLGNGKDGDLTATGTFNINQNSSGSRKHPDGMALKIRAIGDTQTLIVDKFQNDEFIAGDEIFIYCTQGLQNVGIYSFVYLKEVTTHPSGTALVLESPFNNSLTSCNKLIAQRVPNYSNIIPTKELEITADGWNGSVGGIVVFRVKGKINSNTSINTSGIGYRGGVSTVYNSIYLSTLGESTVSNGISASSTLGNNGCGGGNGQAVIISGGGGSYGSRGQIANGLNGFAYSGTIVGTKELNQPIIGCGGGSGISTSYLHGASKGGNGGGVIIIFSNEISFNENHISADGSDGVDGKADNLPAIGSGGGSGGTILINSNLILINNTTLIHAHGGKGSGGSTEFYGADGGVGRIRINYKMINTSPYPDFGEGADSIDFTSPKAFAGSL